MATDMEAVYILGEDTSEGLFLIGAYTTEGAAKEAMERKREEFYGDAPDLVIIKEALQ